MKNVLLQPACVPAERANLLAFCRKMGIRGWSKLALSLFHVWLVGGMAAGARNREAGNYASSGVPGARKFIVMDAALLSIAVLARVGLLCDSGQSDPPT